MSVKSLIARKAGMTSIFDDSGAMVGVTVLSVEPNRVVYVRTEGRDGYDAAALGVGSRREGRSRKPQLEQAKKAGLEAEPQFVREVAVAAGSELEAGATIGVGDVFEVGDFVDVVGTSRGMGFQGTHKRHHFGLGPATHGSKNRREPGSTGQATYPGRVFKGKRMAGQMGNKRRTIRNLRVVGIDAEAGRLLVKGPVPGWDSGLVLIRKAIAKKGFSQA